MPGEKVCTATKRTLIFSGTTGAVGAGAAMIGEQICNMSIWSNLQLVKLVVASGIGSALLALPLSAYHALDHWDTREDEDENFRKQGLKRGLIWISITGGVGSLAGASLLGLVNNNAEGISALSIGMMGGIVIGVCAVCIGGTYYALKTCGPGRVDLGRIIVAEGGQIINNNQRVPLLRDIQAIEPPELIHAPLPEAGAVRIVEERLRLPVNNNVRVEIKIPENSDLVEVDLNDSPPNSPRAAEPKSRRCSIM